MAFFPRNALDILGVPEMCQKWRQWQGRLKRATTRPPSGLWNTLLQRNHSGYQVQSSKIEMLQ
jgi:hypothetical protein